VGVAVRLQRNTRDVQVLHRVREFFRRRSGLRSAKSLRSFTLRGSTSAERLSIGLGKAPAYATAEAVMRTKVRRLSSRPDLIGLEVSRTA
jgi:hypothetical protein